jgi:Tfp pilus assembly protein PilF
MLWYQFGPYEAYLHAGRYDDVRKLADQTLVTYFRSEEAYYYKALTYMADGNVAEARQQLELALLYNKNYQAAQAALNNLGSQP